MPTKYKYRKCKYKIYGRARNLAKIIFKEKKFESRLRRKKMQFFPYRRAFVTSFFGVIIIIIIRDLTHFRWRRFRESGIVNACVSIKHVPDEKKKHARARARALVHEYIYIYIYTRYAINSDFDIFVYVVKIFKPVFRCVDFFAFFPP